MIKTNSFITKHLAITIKKSIQADYLLLFREYIYYYKVAGLSKQAALTACLEINQNLCYPLKPHQIKKLINQIFKNETETD